MRLMTEHIQNVHTKINLVISQDREGEQGVDWKMTIFYTNSVYLLNSEICTCRDCNYRVGCWKGVVC